MYPFLRKYNQGGHGRLNMEFGRGSKKFIHNES
jgi:hypothetical protein